MGRGGFGAGSTPLAGVPLILLGESYNDIRALADLFAVVKIPNNLSGAVAGERFRYLSSNLVGPRI